MTDNEFFDVTADLHERIRMTPFGATEDERSKLLDLCEYANFLRLCGRTEEALDHLKSLQETLVAREMLTPERGPCTLTLEQVLEGTERAHQRVKAWPRWKRDLSESTQDVRSTSPGVTGTMDEDTFYHATGEAAEALRKLGAEPVRNRTPQTVEERQNHLLWMCEQADTLYHAGRKEKAMRWLGFVQGCLWCVGLRSIDDLCATNRGPMGPEGPLFGVIPYAIDPPTIGIVVSEVRRVKAIVNLPVAPGA